MTEETPIDLAVEYAQNSVQVEALAAAETALVDYIPKSKAPYRLGTLIPRNMAFEVQKALNAVVRTHGNIDNLVRNQLKYATTEEMWKGLAAEQVDAIGLYLMQFEQSKGIIIADQTGIGKGRQAAAIIRHSIVNGYLPVFFTRMPDLFTDMYRDLKGIGFDNISPFIVNTDEEARIKDASGNIVFSPLSSAEQKALLSIEKTIPTESDESIEWHRRVGRPLPDPKTTPSITISEVINYLPEGYDAVFCTYSQVQSAHISKRLWLAKMVAAGVEGSRKFKKAVFILDESHMAGGFDSIIGHWMRQVLPETKACCYLSATFAKYPEVMPFYAKKTAITETGLSDGAFVGAMQRGGLALQEIVASNLAESGQLIRRQRSGEGIKVEYIVLDKEPQRSLNRDRVNKVVSLMNRIVTFEQDYIAPILAEIHEDAKKAGEKMEDRPRSLGVKQSPYFSRVFNIIDQMLFSLKVEEVALYALDLLSQDKKVVIAFKSTMGSFLQDLKLASGDIIPAKHLDFTRTLVKGLDAVFKYNYTAINGEKSSKIISQKDLPPRGLEEYEDIVRSMQLESTGLNISPIDQLIQIIESYPKNEKLGGHKGKYFKVAEVTGRTQRIRLDGKEAVVQSFRSDTEKFFRLFNNGDYDVLLINQAGSTGASAHASKDFADQRVRAMLIHQFELDINTEIQKRGRINRTGQISLPEYYYITSDIPAERRLMTMLKGKLKSLDANTTGSQKTSDDTLQTADFMNKYGDKVAWAWVDDNKELMMRMGWPTYHKAVIEGVSTYVRNEGNEGAIKQLTGRAGLLSVEEQEALYNDLLNRYQYQVQWEKQRGTYDLETEFLKLDADVKKRFLFKHGKGGKTPFGKDTIREESIVNNLKRPFTKDELDQVLVMSLEGKKPTQLQIEQINALNQEYPKMVEDRRAKRMEAIQSLREELAEIPPDEPEESEENLKREKYRAKLQALIQEKLEALETYLSELEAVRAHIEKAMRYWLVGDVVKVPIPGTVIGSWGIFIGVSVGKSQNPYTLANISLKFAVTDGRKVVEYNLSSEQRGEISSIYIEDKNISEEDRKKVLLDWNQLVKDASQKREKRHILTANIVGASSEISAINKLIKYNTLEGEIKNGILLSRDFGKEGEDRFALLPISMALPQISNLSVDTLFSDHQNGIRFKRVADQAYELLIVKSGNFELFTDQALRSLLMRQKGQSEDELPDFVQNAGDMAGVISFHNLKACLDILDRYNIRFLGEAREMEEWEVENQQDWQNKTRSSSDTFRYKLARPYGQGSNPITGFVNYEEPSPQYRFGIVEYSRPLSDKEKYNYSLVPLFKNAEVPYLAWKRYMDKSPQLRQEFDRLKKELESIPVHDAVLRLGYFITNNPHEDGNPEFVFGEYTEEELGRIAYEDVLGQVSDLDALIAQLMIELENA